MFRSPSDRMFSRYYRDGPDLVRGPLPSTRIVDGSDLRAFLIWEAEHVSTIYVRDRRPGRWRYAAGMGKAGRPVSAQAVEDAMRRARSVVPGSDPAREWEAGASSRTQTRRAVESCDLAHEACGLPVDPRLRELVEAGDLDRVVVFKTRRRRWDGSRLVEYDLHQVARVRDVIDALTAQAQRVAARALGEP